ncbi:MAG: helix-turn-helix domain-containing protein [Victivallaceae bacterium]|nr:helix-turn-helix domain-containing protein [Victivallaceae bacterium]
MGSVIKKTVQILECAAAMEPCSLAELTDATGMKKPALYQILKSLTETGMLEKDNRRKYHLGSRLFQLTMRRRKRDALRYWGERIAQETGKELGESITIAAILDGHYRRIAVENTRHSIRVVEFAYEDGRFYRNATGRMLLAQLPEQTRNKIIAEDGLPTLEEWPEIGVGATLESALQKIAALGIAEASSADGQAVYLAVAPASGQRSAQECIPIAVGCNLPSFRFTDAHRKYILETMWKAADRLFALLNERST